MRKITRKGIIRKLDKIVSQIVIARDGKCIVCGTTQSLTCGHLFSRVAYSTRWNLENCYAQCLSCNLKHEYDSFPMIEAVKEKWTKDHPKLESATIWLANLHYEWNHPVKFKTYELEELYDQLNIKYLSLK